MESLWVGGTEFVWMAEVYMCMVGVAAIGWEVAVVRHIHGGGGFVVISVRLWGCSSPCAAVTAASECIR